MSAWSPNNQDQPDNSKVHLHAALISELGLTDVVVERITKSCTPWAPTSSTPRAVWDLEARSHRTGSAQDQIRTHRRGRRNDRDGDPSHRIGPPDRPSPGRTRHPEPEIDPGARPGQSAKRADAALRTELLLLHEGGRGANMLAVLGSDPGEGRSQLCGELAISFAQLGRRTLLVDADMRKPQQHVLFGSTNQHGLSQAIAHNEKPTSTPSPACRSCIS